MVKIIAELGCNHSGNFDLAKKMIFSAKQCNADYVKFQKRNCYIAVPLHIQNKPHPCPMNAFGETYLQHRLFLEFSLEQHKELKNICQKEGIGYACSVWDEDSAREIISLDTDYIKVPSALNNDYELLKIIFGEYKKNVHISLGMATKKEREDLFKFLLPHKNRIVLYWTTSDYPVNFDELFLLEISNLLKIFPSVGFSGHHLGIAVDVAAVVLGATWVERHFTLDRTMKGTDHSASLEQPGLSKLVRDIRATERALKYKGEGITFGEEKNREKLRKL